MRKGEHTCSHLARGMLSAVGNGLCAAARLDACSHVESSSCALARKMWQRGYDGNERQLKIRALGPEVEVVLKEKGWRRRPQCHKVARGRAVKQWTPFGRIHWWGQQITLCKARTVQMLVQMRRKPCAGQCLAGFDDDCSLGGAKAVDAGRPCSVSNAARQMECGMGKASGRWMQGASHHHLAGLTQDVDKLLLLLLLQASSLSERLGN